MVTDLSMFCLHDSLFEWYAGPGRSQKYHLISNGHANVVEVVGCGNGLRHMSFTYTVIYTDLPFTCWCRPLITFENTFDPDQARRNVGPDLDPKCLITIWYS